MDQEALMAVKAFCEEIKEAALPIYGGLSLLLTRHLELNCQLLAPLLFLPGTIRLEPGALSQGCVCSLITSGDGKRSVVISFVEEYVKLGFRGRFFMLKAFSEVERSTEVIDFAIEYLLLNDE